MILERGNMWDVFGKTDLFLITTNPIRRKDGAVVMGRGIAKEAATKYPQLPFDFGKVLEKFQYDPWFGAIGVYDHQPVGFFMVKDHWRDAANPNVIEASMIALDNYLFDGPADYRVDLNFPGIGNGKLKREDVLPIIEQLPDNVHVWEYK